MKVIPKFQQGGFAVYQRMYQPQKQQQESTEKQTTTTKESKDSGEITKKDLFDLISKIDGLPNDMMQIAGSIKSLLSSSLTTTSESDISNAYFNNIYQLKIAQFNKKEYDNAFDAVSKTGGLNEIAITTSGGVIVKDKDGQVQEVLYTDYMKNRKKYHALTNSNLLNMRAYDPKYANQNSILSVVHNGVGMNEVNKQIKDRMYNMGTTSMNLEHYSLKRGKDIARGLNVLSEIDAQKEAYTNGMTLDGLYKNGQISKEQKQQAEAALSYIYSSLPDNSKILLGIKSGDTANPSRGAMKMIYSMIMSRTSSTFENSVTFEGNEEQVLTKGLNSKGASTQSGNSGESGAKSGPYYNMSRMIGATDSEVVLNKGTNYEMSTAGKVYGSIPDSQGNPVASTSLRTLLSSGFAGIVTDPNAITFGNVNITPDKFDDIMYNGAGGTMAVLPCKTVMGRKVVDLDVLDRWKLVNEQLRSMGIRSVLDPDKQKEITQVLMDNNLYDYVNMSKGQINLNKVSQFMVIDGYVVDKDDTFENSDWVISADEDDVGDAIKRALSTNSDKNNYKIDGDIYQGSIYIPITNNQLQAMTADGLKMKEGVAQGKEHDYQDFWKMANMGSTKTSQMQ